MYTLGALLGALYYVPLVNLLVPVLSGLAFAHFGLARLSELELGKVKGTKSTEYECLQPNRTRLQLLLRPPDINMNHKP